MQPHKLAGAVLTTHLPPLNTSSTSHRRQQYLTWAVWMQALSGSLEVLAAAQCGLREVAALAVLRELQSLDLSGNAVADVTQVQKVLAGCPQLQTLSLQGNPLCKESTYRSVASAHRLPHGSRSFA